MDDDGNDVEDDGDNDADGLDKASDYTIRSSLSRGESLLRDEETASWREMHALAEADVEASAQASLEPSLVGDPEPSMVEMEDSQTPYLEMSYGDTEVPAESPDVRVMDGECEVLDLPDTPPSDRNSSQREAQRTDLVRLLHIVRMKMPLDLATNWQSFALLNHSLNQC